MTDLIQRLEGADRKSIDSAEVLAELWHKKHGIIPENLRVRVETAAILANQPLTDSMRTAIADLIADYVAQIQNSNFDFKRFEWELKGFIEGRLNLFDLFQLELGELGDLQSKNPNDELISVAHKINSRVYDLLKTILEGDIRADALISNDKVIDDNRNEDFNVAIQRVLGKIHELLGMIAKFKSASILYVNPDPDKSELVPISYPEKEQQAPLTENPYQNFEWQSYEDKDLKVFYTLLKDEQNNSCKLVFKLSLGDEDFGNIEYEFETPGIHPIVLSKCSCISAMLDTFLNARLQNEIKELIEAKKREIQNRHSVKEWPTIISELCVFLSKIIKKPFVFDCDNKPGSENSFTVLINGDHVVPIDKETVEEFEWDSLPLHYHSENGTIQVGQISFEQTDKTRQGIIDDSLSFFEGVIMWREEKRNAVNSSQGSLVADLRVADDLEEEPSPHPDCVLFADIDDYSTLTEILANQFPEKRKCVPKILSRFYAEAKLEIEQKFHVVVDKYVGDEIIVLIGPPYNKKGEDAFGNKEPDFADYIDRSYEIWIELQRILEQITNEVVEKVNKETDGNLDWKLPRPLKLACGAGLTENDDVGLYGNPDKVGAGLDYTQIGPGMNKIARICGQADGGEFIMPLSSFDTYQLKGGNKLKIKDVPYTVKTKGVGLVDVVKIEKK